ncbi:hypothetical protein G1H11_08505 [Phytoactinopolyspora alkaliphila]|uniref:Endonuclease/exonuclease/phosphatase domain-containing protein n=1 Tax=Phytoactinopolyspora alkaliphila TaxID=1783498 RepID=A0A6N9YK08_9ACTN|nr:hypothetical protein [Phytoactinopolyspora alkaliphila]
MGMRVMTANVLSPAHADWERRRDVLASEFERLAPDMLALQEVASTEFLPPAYAVAWHSVRSRDGVGTALASRWPLGAVDELDLRATPRAENLPWAGPPPRHEHPPQQHGTGISVWSRAIGGRPAWAARPGRPPKIAARGEPLRRSG